MKKTLALASILFLTFTSFNLLAQVDAKMIQYPDVSQTQIVFNYGGDLWLVQKQGGTAFKLSSPAGQESFPRFSPDGNQIAYDANYNGNTDIYVISSQGGIPKRVTNHGMTERLVDWYPNGKDLLFASSQFSGKQRFSQLFKVSTNGGLPVQLPLAYAEAGSFSADGSKIVFTPRTTAFRTWKRYRGGMNSDVWIYDLEKKTADRMLNNDYGNEFPMWGQNKIYWISDRGAEKRYNIWSYNISNKELKQLTKFTDFDVHFPSMGPEEIVFEAGGKLFLFNLASEKTTEVKVNLITDKIALMPKVENVSKLIANASISPDGKRAIFEARGELFDVPAQNGPSINLTKTSGIAERYPAWSPDGKSVAYWSDKSGEYELTLKYFEKPDNEKKLTSLGKGFRYNLFWSPNSKMLAFIDKAMTIYVYDLDKDKMINVDKALYFMHGPSQNFNVSWSSDSRWMAYSRDLKNQSSAIFLFDSKEGKTHQVTTGYYADTNPAFDPDGKYLYFTTNRTLNPVYSDIDNSWIYPNTTNLAVATLSSETPDPLSPKVDTLSVKKEEINKDDKEMTKEKSKEEKKDGTKEKEKNKDVKITLEDFENRVVILPVAAGNMGSVQAVSGKVVYLRSPNSGSADKKSTVKYFDFDKREEKTIVEDANGFSISADGKKMLAAKTGQFAIVDVAENQKMDKLMPTSDLEMVVDPKTEWKQIYTDSWRLFRDYFYDENMHGVDWDKLGQQYGKLVDDCVTRWDLNYLIGELISELNASHTYRSGGDTDEAKTINVGYLGIDWEVHNGAYKIKQIVKGAPWDTEVVSPLSLPGVKVKEGDYILRVNGVSLNVNEAPWIFFQGLSGKTIELTVNDKPTLDGSHNIYVQALEDETRLRNLAWIESNRKHVEKASNGKIGYIYVPSTGRDGQTELVRQFAAQITKEGLIIDERFNNGGQIPDRFIELLDRKPLAFWSTRDGEMWQWPPHAHFGPKAMLINGWSGSGGDAFPDYFRKAGLGKLIGERTWGGLIGISGAPGLIDGGNVSVPTFRMIDPDGKWFREGYGVDPDIEVLDDPAQLAKGIDPQLDRAIQEVLKELETNKFNAPKVPASEKR
ncbi:MAG: peptidase S41 [Ignavibacteriae bacterium HGW-Ignavibacteriae-3]|nr:MAG: peptidase S41 [Ignavibacteriae bacterium HGW-Ignavibacteriae-3]